MIELTLRNLPLPKGPEMGQHFETAENLLLVSWWYNWKKSCATFDPAPSRSINVHDSPAPVLKRKLGMTFFLKVSAHECWPRSLPRVSGEIWPWTDLCSLWFPAQVGCLVEVSPVPGGGREILSGKGSWGPEITARTWEQTAFLVDWKERPVPLSHLLGHREVTIQEDGQVVQGHLGRGVELRK